jgi:hypothetical protein
MPKIVKIILTLTLLFAILLLIIWRIYRTFYRPYIPDFTEHIRDDVTTLKFTVPKDRDNCEKVGGIWKKLGPRPFEECNIPTKDAGKECISSKLCEGVCLAELTKDQLSSGMRGKLFKTKGKCSDVIKVLGCRAYVYQGWAQVICAD